MFEIVVDITEVPKVKFIPVNTRILLRMVNDGVLGCSGLTKEQFYKLLFGRLLEDKDFELIPIYDVK